MNFNNLKYLFKEGIKNIWSNRTMSFASVGVLVSCLLLTGAAVLFSMNIDSAMKSIEGNNSITVYFDTGLPTLSSVQVASEIKKIENIDNVEFVSKDDAVESLLGMLGDDGTVMAGLFDDVSFLPDACKITMKDLALYDETVAEVLLVDGVDQINDYSDIADKLTQLDGMITTAGLWIILLLSLVSLFINANTIRVTMFSRRLEISIMKSVGATNWFVRVPFVVEGVLIGLFSGALSSFLLLLVYDKLLGSISGVLAFFEPIDIAPLRWKLVLAFLGAGVLFGAAGGIISIGRYLKKEGGEIVGW